MLYSMSEKVRFNDIVFVAFYFSNGIKSRCSENNLDLLTKWFQRIVFYKFFHIC